MPKFIDMTGWIMAEHGVPDSRLKVIKRVDDYISPQGVHQVQWLCECSCKEHNKTVVGSVQLRNGNTKSCGCLASELTKQRNFKGNKADLSGEYGVLWTTNTNEEVYFDLCYAEKILEYTWANDGHGYPTTSIDGKNIRMHTFLGYKGHDHIDRNKNNNRVENLRPCSQHENAMNQSKQQNTSSQYIGIYYAKDRGQWRAHICLNNKTINLGSYATEKEALIARLKAEKDYFGDFAPQRDLFSKYKI